MAHTWLIGLVDRHWLLYNYCNHHLNLARQQTLAVVYQCTSPGLLRKLQYANSP
jgi:hypothetical protein